MKAIINGFRFDTEKAIKIGEASSVISRSDFSWWEASLYRTPRANRFFLAGKGGPMTSWARSVDTNTRTGSSGIIPMEQDEALEWAECYLSVEEIEKGFATIVQDA